ISNIANGNWENLQFSTFEANTNGKLEVFVFNESNVNVWFDDMQIQHIPTLISQENHYYAFGMNAKEVEKEGSNRFQYNKMAEKNEFMGLDWYDTKYRNLDTEIGRWLQVDPKADEGHLSSLTPYNSMDNNPIRYNDPDGDCPFCLVPILVGMLIGGSSDAVVQYAMNGEVSNISSVVVSSISGAFTGGSSSLIINTSRTMMGVSRNLVMSDLIINTGDSMAKQLLATGEISGVKTLTDVAVATTTQHVPALPIGKQSVKIEQRLNSRYRVAGDKSHNAKQTSKYVRNKVLASKAQKLTENWGQNQVDDLIKSKTDKLKVNKKEVNAPKKDNNNSTHPTTKKPWEFQ
ncbi:MAG: hypothetical protein EAY69_01360, partial [Cytophagales bacterium]